MSNLDFSKNNSSFSSNLRFLSVLFTGFFLGIIFTKTIGREILILFTTSNLIPGIILAVIFTGAIISAIVSLKKEESRDVVLLYVNLFVVGLVFLMLPHIIEGNDMTLKLSNVLGFGIAFRVNILTLYMLIIASLLWFMVTLYSHSYMNKKEKSGGRFYFWFMVAYGGAMGAIMADSLITMFLFFEIMYISCYFLVAHSATPEAIKAGYRYIFMGVVGGLSMLLAVIILHVNTGTFDLMSMSNYIVLSSDGTGRMLLVALIFMLIGFSIKTAIFPLHFWLPGAHSSAPAPASAILSGLIIKVYVFSLIKFLYVGLGLEIVQFLRLPEFLPYLASVGMIAGSVFALRQKELKKMLAYSTVAQVGYMILGIGLSTPLGISATLFHILTHMITKSALFLCAGAMYYHTGKKDIGDYKGIACKMPVTMGIFTLAALSMIGIPGLVGFMSKWYLSIAAIDAGMPYFVIVLLISSFLNAMYYLPIIINAFLIEPEDGQTCFLRDPIPNNMLFPLVGLGIGLIFFGIFPKMVVSIFQMGITFM